MAKYKLGIVNSCSLEKSYGGIAPFMKNLDSYLTDSYDVTYVVLPDFLYNIQFIPRRFIFVLYLLWKRRQLKRFDAILSHEMEGSWVLSYGPVPFAHIFHGNNNPMSQSRFWYGKYFKSLFARMEKRIIRNAKLMYTVGSERPGIPKIVNPINHHVKIKPPETRRGFIFSGRLEKIKNIDRIITIYSKINPEIREGHPLYIAGRGSQERSLKNIASILGIADSVIFLGNLPNNDLVEADSSKKILLMASAQEGFPMAIAEALSVGVPVISTNVGDIPRFLQDNYDGFLLPIGFDDREYIERIEAILNDYERFARNAMASAEVFKAENIAHSLSEDINTTILHDANSHHSQ